jgi:hypothetical protein
LDFRYEAVASTAAVPLSDRVSFTNTLTLSGVIPGMAYRIRTGLDHITDNSVAGAIATPRLGYPVTLLGTVAI